MDELSLAHTWTAQETLDNIKSILPQDWSIKFVESPTQEGMFFFSILDQSNQVQWSQYSVFTDILLLSAYSWLYLKVNKLQRSPNWSRPHGDAVQLPVFTDMGVETSDEPEDLSPTEFESLYDQYRKT